MTADLISFLSELKMSSSRRTLYKLRYQLHILKGHAKCRTVPQLRKLVIRTRAAEQGSK